MCVRVDDGVRWRNLGIVIFFIGSLLFGGKLVAAVDYEAVLDRISNVEAFLDVFARKPDPWEARTKAKRRKKLLLQIRNDLNNLFIEHSADIQKIMRLAYRRNYIDVIIAAFVLNEEAHDTTSFREDRPPRIPKFQPRFVIDNLERMRILTQIAIYLESRDFPVPREAEKLRELSDLFRIEWERDLSKWSEFYMFNLSPFDAVTLIRYRHFVLKEGFEFDQLELSSELVRTEYSVLVRSVQWPDEIRGLEGKLRPLGMAALPILSLLSFEQEQFRDLLKRLCIGELGRKGLNANSLIKILNLSFFGRLEPKVPANHPRQVALETLRAEIIFEAKKTERTSRQQMERLDPSNNVTVLSLLQSDRALFIEWASRDDIVSDPAYASTMRLVTNEDPYIAFIVLSRDEVLAASLGSSKLLDLQLLALDKMKEDLKHQPVTRLMAKLEDEEFLNLIDSDALIQLLEELESTEPGTIVSLLMRDPIRRLLLENSPPDDFARLLERAWDSARQASNTVISSEDDEAIHALLRECQKLKKPNNLP